MCVASSVTRLGGLLHFGQLFETCGQNYFAQIAYILGNLCKGVKIFHFSGEIIFGQLLWTFGDFLLVTLIRCWFFFPFCSRLCCRSRAKCWSSHARASEASGSCFCRIFSTGLFIHLLGLKTVLHRLKICGSKL